MLFQIQLPSGVANLDPGLSDVEVKNLANALDQSLDTAGKVVAPRPSCLTEFLMCGCEVNLGVFW